MTSMVISGRARIARHAVVTSAVVYALLGGAAATAQQAAPDMAKAPPPPVEPAKDDVVVIGRRGSILGGINAVAVLDSTTIAATGATTIAELLRAIRGITQSANGSDPIFLLNGQRISGYPDIGSLPPEAIEKVEVLPEPAALNFGYPPTRRVLNFITKRRFRQMEVRGTAGTTTRGGSARGNVNLGLTRLRDDSRLTLGLELRRTDPLLQSERGIATDPAIVFDAIGNITGVGGGEIDPALSAAAGSVVNVAPVPAAPGDRTSLTGYAAGANRARLFDVGRYRTLVAANDAVKAEAVFADRLGDTLAGSLSLGYERSSDRPILGPAVAMLAVPAGNPASPFSRTVVLNRYLVEARSLRARQTTTNLRAGGTLRGTLAGWRWDATAALEQKRIAGFSDRGIDLAAANAAIAAGANPFLPLDPALHGTRLTDRARQRTRTAGLKSVATNTPFDVPAGPVTITATAEYERSSAVSETRGPNPFDLRLGRSRIEGGVAIDMPLASRRQDVLPFVGELSINASFNARRVGGFGSLDDHTMGVTWAPFDGLQLLAQSRHSATAPGVEQLSSPEVRVANIYAFDFTNVRTELVTIVQGGNRDLLAERRRVRSLSMTIKPFAKREIRLGATYEATVIRNQTGTVYALTPETEPVLPDLFTRDASGRLTSITIRPINFYRERLQTLNMTVSASGSVGKPPLPPAGGGPAKMGERPSYYLGMGPSIKFSDRLQLRPGAPELDILRGDTVTGGGSPRAYGYAYGGISYLGNGGNFDFWYGGGSRVRNPDPAADLRYEPIFRLNASVFLSLHHFTPKQDWTRRVQVKLEVSNVTDARQSVRDRRGRVPNRLQPGFLDPVGRVVSLTLRKLF
ncbi:hypothetical protein [uncultured Sphingomonas sp.]|uniref:hypothetical protein n=1 Tax=uncultured Sphingomonas sp. TaxID=158754 RepID=UPI0035C971B5